MSTPPDPTRFLDDMRGTIRAQRAAHGVVERPTRLPGDRLVMNRSAVDLFLAAMRESDPAGHYQIPAVVMLGQRGQIGFLDAAAVFYDPALDENDGPVVRYVVED